MTTYESTTNANFSPRRFGVAPLMHQQSTSPPASGRRHVHSDDNTNHNNHSNPAISSDSFSPIQPSVLASRLTQKELKEPLGHSPIRDSGKARFGIMEKRNMNEFFVAGKATPRGDSVGHLLANQFTSTSTSASSPSNKKGGSARHEGAGAGGNNGNLDDIYDEQNSPRKNARMMNTQQTFSALPGGSEALASHRFGKTVHSDDTVKTIVTPRFQETHLTASPAKLQSKRHFGADPSSLPPACKPTVGGVSSKAAYSASRSKDTVGSLFTSMGDLQAQQQKYDSRCVMKESTGKVNQRQVPPTTIASPRRRPDDFNEKVEEFKRQQKQQKMLARMQEEAEEHDDDNNNNEKQEYNDNDDDDDDHEDPRTYGVPTIRQVNVPPATRKLTDPNNYGDEPSSGDLVLGGGQSAVVGKLMAEKCLKSPEDAVAWSKRGMFGLTDEEAKYAFIAATESTQSSSISLKEFKQMVDMLFP